MLVKRFYLGVVVGAILLVGVAHSVPLDDAWETLEAEELRTGEGWEATTVDPTGWGWVPPTGDTSAFGQTMVIQNFAASNQQSNPTVVEATAGWDAAGHPQTVNMTLNTTQNANFEVDINGGMGTTGGGSAGVDGAYVSVDGNYGFMNQEANYNASINITGLSSGGIISNPQTSASISAGTIVASSSGQVTNGNNVNPGWGSSGWGWGNQGGSGWRDQGSGWSEETTVSPGWSSGWGWPANSEGQTASASSIEAINNLSQQASASDDITVVVHGNNETPVNLTGTIAAPVQVNGEFNGNGVYVEIGDGETQGAETEWQGLEYNSNSENNQTISVTNANATAISSKPNSTTTVSMSGLVISDFVTATSGVNLVNQNVGGSGWGQQPQGWGQPSQGWGKPPQGQGWKQ